MDYYGIVAKIYTDGADFNPACFNFTEKVAREKKLWRDPRPMPTQEELQAVLAEIVIEEDKVKYKKSRKSKYDEQGLSFDKWIELEIEQDEEGKAAFRAARNIIKQDIPKPAMI